MRINSLACIFLLSAALGAYEKQVMPHAATMSEVRSLLGSPTKIVNVPGNMETLAVGYQEWHYDRRVWSVNAVVRTLTLHGVNPEWMLILGPNDITYDREYLEPVRRFTDRFLTADLEIGSPKVTYNRHISSNKAAFRVEFTVQNASKSPLGRVDLMVSFVDKPDDPLSDAKATRIALGESLPGVVYAKSEEIQTEALSKQTINVPGFIRFAAYTSDGKLLSVGNSTHKVLPK